MAHNAKRKEFPAVGLSTTSSHTRSGLAGLTLAAVGVVYGAIGTSPLYALKEVFAHGHVRLTPENSFNSMSDSDPQAHFVYFVEQLSPRGLAYVHVLEPFDTPADTDIAPYLRNNKFPPTLVCNETYTLNPVGTRRPASAGVGV